MTQLPIPPGLSGGENTRITNQMIRAKQMSFGNNAAAINSLRQITAGPHHRPRSQVGGYQDTSMSSGPGMLPPPVVNPQSPPAMAPNNSAPSAPMPMQQEDPIEKFNRNQAVDKIISSPEMMDTVTRLKLRNHFKGRSDDGLGVEALDSIRGNKPLG